MKVEGEGRLLRIFIGESDRWEGRPLYEAIVRAARQQGLAGATAIRGIEGFGANSRIHTVKILRLSEDLPIVVEIADRADRIAEFMPTVDKMVGEGMVTLEKVNIAVYRHGAGDQPSAIPADDDEEIQLESSEPEVPAEPAARFAKASDRTRHIIDSAKQAAVKSRRVYVDSVDVLLAMLRENTGVAGRVLANLNVDVGTVERCLGEQVSRDEPSAAYLAALDAKSLREAKWLDHHYAGTEHLLLALCEIRPSAATDVLMRLGVQPRDICREVLELLGFHDDWQRWLADHPDM
jgi:PII-like signaling protein